MINFINYKPSIIISSIVLLCSGGLLFKAISIVPIFSTKPESESNIIWLVVLVLFVIYYQYF